MSKARSFKAYENGEELFQTLYKHTLVGRVWVFMFDSVDLLVLRGGCGMDVRRSKQKLC